MNQLFGHQPA